jgi:hypothetical protein
MRKTRRSKRFKRRTRKLRGGDYRKFTAETVRGTPVTLDAAVTTPTATLTLKEFKEMQAAL